MSLNQAKKQTFKENEPIRQAKYMGQAVLRKFINKVVRISQRRFVILGYFR
jgi:hypothetical protein